MKKDMVIRTCCYALSIFIFIFIWSLWSNGVNNFILAPSPIDTLKRLFDILGSGKTYVIIGYTVLRLLCALAVSFIIALAFSILAYRFKYVDSFLKPLVSGLRTVPIASIVVIILIITNKELAPYIMTFLLMFPLFYSAFLNGFKNISIDDTLNVYLLDSNFNLKVLRHIHLPLIVPYIKMSLIQAIGLGFKGLVMSEFIAQTKYSIGKAIYDSKNTADFDIVFAWTLILIFLVIIMELALNLFKEHKPKEKPSDASYEHIITDERMDELTKVLIEQNQNSY